MIYLHSHRPTILHRDLKSPNLLVAKDWRVQGRAPGTLLLWPGRLAARSTAARRRRRVPQAARPRPNRQTPPSPRPL